MPLAFGNVENTDFVSSASIGAVTTWNFDISALAPASGNLLVLEAFLDSATQAFAAVSGWTAALNSAQTNGTVGVFWKISNGAETTVTLAPAANTYQILGLCKKYTGAHATTPIPVITSSQQAGGSNWNSPSIDTAGTDGCHLCFGGFTQPGTSDWLSGDEPDTTTLVKQATGDSSWWGSAFETQTTGGVTGTRLWTNSSNGKTAYSYAVAPAETSTVALKTSTSNASSSSSLSARG